MLISLNGDSDFANILLFIDCTSSFTFYHFRLYISKDVQVVPSVSFYLRLNMHYITIFSRIINNVAFDDDAFLLIESVSLLVFLRFGCNMLHLVSLDHVYYNDCKNSGKVSYSNLLSNKDIVVSSILDL